MTIQEEQTIIEVALPDLLREVERLHADGYRLVQIGCTGIGGAYEINYSFDKGYHLRNLRLNVGPDTEVPSISGIYWGRSSTRTRCTTSLGSRFRINIDFKGTFIRTAKKYPFSVARKGEDACQDE